VVVVVLVIDLSLFFFLFSLFFSLFLLLLFLLRHFLYNITYKILQIFLNNQQVPFCLIRKSIYYSHYHCYRQYCQVFLFLFFFFILFFSIFSVALIHNDYVLKVNFVACLTERLHQVTLISAKILTFDFVKAMLHESCMYPTEILSKILIDYGSRTQT